MRRELVPFFAGVVACAIALALYLSMSDGSTPPSAGVVAKERFIALRTDRARLPAMNRVPASIAAPAMPEPEFEALIDSAIDPLQEFAAGDPSWEDTAFAINDLFWLREERLQCAQDHALPLIAYCRADYRMVVTAGGSAGMGTIIDGEATASLLSESASDAERAACMDYAQCLLRARIGSSIPIPEDQPDTLAIRQPTLYAWASASLFDPIQVGELIRSYERSLGEIAGNPRLDQGLSHRMEQHQLDYLRHHLAALEEATE